MRIKFPMVLVLLATILVPFVVLLTSCAQTEQEVELTISAAISLKDALTEIAEHFNEQYPDVSLIFNYGGSGALQQQIEQHAPVDLFISAAKDTFNELIAKGLVDDRYVTDLLTNELVLIVPKTVETPIHTLTDLADETINHIAIGTPETVPAGKYAQKTLQYNQLWDKLTPKLVYTKDVRQVLAYVETGNVEAGFVYKTDALPSDKVNIALTVDPLSHPPIVYPVGVVKHAKHYDEAIRFFTFLQSETAHNVFEKYGFTINRKGHAP